MNTIQKVCVFLGSNPGDDPAFCKTARAMGAAIAARGLTLVYGGSNMGCMAELANAALAGGARVEGVIPRQLVDRERAHLGLSNLMVVGSMHERKAGMAERADAFIAMPGGLGTLEEFFEVATWAQLGFHQKPCGLLNVQGYYAPLAEFLDSVVARGFLSAAHRSLILLEDTPVSMLDALATYEPAFTPKWIARKEEL